MRPKEILPDLFFFRRGFLNGNHFAWRGEKPVLIDTGYTSGLHDTLAAIRSVGVAPERVMKIVSTHCHCDHIGGNAAIHQMSGCVIATHRIGKGFADSGDRIATWWDWYGQEADAYPVLESIEDGDDVIVGPYRFRALHLPGHSLDGLALYQEEEQVLLSSDLLWERDLPVVNVAVEGEDAPQQLMRSLERLATLEVRLVAPGHGPLFTDARCALERAMRRVGGYIDDPVTLGVDVVKKIMVYTLLMYGPLAEATFLARLRSVPWFPDTAERYFGGDEEGIYRQTLDGLLDKGAVVRRDGQLITTVKP